MSATPLTEHSQAPSDKHGERAATATGSLREPCVLLKLGEIVLKGGNRHQFEQMLQANIRRALKETGVEIRFWQRDGVVVLRVAAGPTGNAAAHGPAAEAAADKIAERVKDVMGIARVCRAVRVARNPEAATAAAVDLAAGKQGSFAVRA